MRRTRRNRDGKTPSDLAAEHDLPQVVEWIAQTPEGRSEAAARDAEERAAAQADAEREQHRQERRARERVAIDLLRGSTKSNGTSSS